MIIDVSATDVSAVFLLENVHLSTGETAQENTQFRMSKIDEKNISCVISIEFTLSEDTIIKSNSGRLIEKSCDSQLCYFSCIEKCFSLLLIEVGGNCNYCGFAIEVVLF